MGKTNSKHIRVKIEDTSLLRDVSASVSNISGVGTTYAEQDVTAYSDGIVNFTLGNPSSEIELSGPLSNTAVVGAHTVLSAIAGDQSQVFRLLVEIGILAAPTYSAPEFHGEYYCASYMVNADATYTARLVPANATVPSWSELLYPSTSISVTTSGTEVNMGADWTGGAIGYLRVTSADAGGPWTLTIEESNAGGGGWSTFLTFAADGQSLVNEQKSEATNMDQYVRFVATDLGAGSGATFEVSLIKL